MAGAKKNRGGVGKIDAVGAYTWAHPINIARYPFHKFQ
jgi:hypothetical protein